MCPDDELIAAFSEGRVAAAEAAELHRHIDACATCQWLLREMSAPDESAAPAPAVYSAGVVVGGRYRLERRLGAGGMGTVWAALHLGTDRPVALKLLRRERASTVEARRRFLREARLLGRVDHENLVAVRDVFEDHGVPILAMDLLDGETLGERLRKRGRLTLPETARILGAVIGALDAAHAAGIVHRDLKPDNIFLVAGGGVRVLDFGVAKLLNDSDVPPLTATGEVLGTPAYMAPEQLRGESVDLRADVWSFGVMLYECLSGRRPFAANGFTEYVDKVNAGKREPLVARVPVSISALVDNLLTVERNARPDNLREAARILVAPPRRAPIVIAAALTVATLGGLGWWLHTPAPKPRALPPVAAPPPSPPPSGCEAWPGASPKLCTQASLAMRASAYRAAQTLVPDGNDATVRRDLAACRDDETCLLARLQAATPRISVIDCAHAVSDDARTICSSVPLANLAGSLAAHYQTNRENYARNHQRLQRLSDGRTAINNRPIPSPATFSVDQNTWLATRRRCASDEPCLTRALTDRITQLAALHTAFTAP
jgi:serine/threonine-protein kinase